MSSLVGTSGFRRKLSMGPFSVVAMDPDLSLLDADAVLAAAEDNERAARAADGQRLQIAVAWADLHGVLDQRPGGAVLPGADRLVRLGGDGTPEVSEFAPAELGAVMGVSADSAAALIGDALDLRHRLPLLWARVLSGDVRAWVAWRVAQICRPGSARAAAVVDARVAPFAHSLPIGRLERVAEAAMIDADPEAAEQTADAVRETQGVWLASDTAAGCRDILIRTDAASATQFDDAVGRVADALAQLGDDAYRDVRRAKAVGVLASPQAALDLCDDAAADSAEPGRAHGRRSTRTRPKAVLYVHLTDDALRAKSGVARVEGIGPVVAGRAREWLGRCDVAVKPVLDLAGVAPVDGYEVPDAMREALVMRTPADVFPYSGCTSRRMDLDHTEPYRAPDDGGPPGQTSLRNLGPMTRRHHRVKTHAGWAVRQISDGVYLCRSPNGRHFLVDQTGTTAVTPARS
jgi:hypothetical protein